MRRPSPGLLAWCVLAASFAATAASAADMPVPAPAYTPPAYHPPVYDWSGIYIGGNVGGTWMNDVVTTTATTVFQNAGVQTKVGPFGVIGGAQAGFNVQFSPVVVGFEGAWYATNLSGTRQTPAAVSGGVIGLFQQSTDAAPWLATAAARIGYAANDLLFYAKGGGAWMRADYTQSVTATCAPQPTQPPTCSGGGVVTQQTLTNTRTGFVAGVGFEYGMNENLSIRVEYDYLGFGTKAYTFNNLSYTTVAVPGGPTMGPFGIGPFPISVNSSLQMVTAGVNYRFTWR
jgi:outer membrane immunogenic protein